MSWLEIAALVIVGLGLFAGAFLVAQRPSFWVGMGAVLLKAVWPYLVRFVTAPEDEATRRARQQCERSGGVWDHARKRCKNR